MNNTLMYKLGAFAAATTSLVKKADLSEIMGDPEALQTLGLLGGAGVAAGGAAAYPFIAKAAPARPSSMAEGLEGGDRGRLRRIFEHLVDPSSSSAHQRGLEMRAGMGPNKAEALAEKMRGEHGMGEKFLRGLSLALAPLKLPLSPVLAPAHAIQRIADRKNFDSAMRSSMGPVAQTFYGMFDPENATTPAQAYLAKEVRRLSGGKELPMGDFREAFEKQQAKSNT